MVVLGLVAAAVGVGVTALTPHGQTDIIAPGPGTSAGPTTPGPAEIYVHVLGQVEAPGLYVLRAGDRAVDAVAAAGGFTADADPAGVNLARQISDGEQLVIPAVGEATAPSATTSDGRVNLNTADAAALETLPRIGPAMAQRILDWRERNGRFASVEDLLDVAGIGAATLDQLRDLVTV
ncbi:MAG: ComEA family DNA-binding protein [Microbacteriaceae bacterium]|nr:ComEA family DNA-binding protein [Microbacteriaceae bacterium]